MARYEIIERYRREGSGLLDRLLLPWAVRTVGSAETIEEAQQLRDRLEHERPEIAPLGIWDSTTAGTDEGGVTTRVWIDYPWRRGWLARRKHPRAHTARLPTD